MRRPLAWLRRARSRASVRLRILGWYIVLMAAATVFGVLLQRSVLLAQLDDEIDARLAQEVEELQQLATGNDPDTGQPFGSDLRSVFDTFLSRNIPSEGEVLFTLVDGRPYASTLTPVQLFQNDALVERWAAVTSPIEDRIDTEAGRVHYLAAPVVTAGDEPAGVFVVAIFLAERQEEINRVLRVGLLVFGSTLFVASGIAWFAAGRVLRPLDDLTDAARSISDENWARRIDVQGDDQIAELATTFNEMLDRLEAAFGAQRRFIDDAGHELRTPITIVRGHLELMGDDPVEREETVRLVMDELDRMSRMVEDLLLLARSEQPDFLDLRPVDVAELTYEIAAKAAALGPRGWQVEQAAEVVLRGDRQRLTQAMMNLASNVVQHTPEGTAVSLGSRAIGPHVLLWVSDAAGSIDPGDRQRLFERFARGTAGRRSTDGTGLGLSIVKAIAEAHGGEVRLESTPHERTTFTLELPMSGPAGAEA